MPFYEYECPTGHRFTQRHKTADIPPLVMCSEHGRSSPRRYSTFQFNVQMTYTEAKNYYFSDQYYNHDRLEEGKVV